MKEGVKWAALSLLGLVVLVAVAFVLGLGGLQWKRFFAPRHENVRREVFEETQSYVHGKVQDLAKYKDEYDKADSAEDREAVRQVIVLRYAEFDETKIKAAGLRAFLVRMRGY
jgi:hypothetical protein